MLGLPVSTEVRKAIPKDALFSKFNVSGKEKNRFDDQIHKITVMNIINPNTVNLEPTEKIKSVNVIEVKLNDPDYDTKMIDLFNRMGHKAIYVMSYDNRCRLAVYEGKIFQTKWNKLEDVKIELNGLDLGHVWANIVRTIGGLSETEDFDEFVQKAIHNEKIQKQIDLLEKKLSKEKQNHMQRELFAQIQELKKQMK